MTRPKKKSAITLPQRSMQVVENKGGITWVNVFRPTTSAMQSLQKRFPFLLDIDLQDCLPPFQRPKLLERKDYLFMVLIFPVYDSRTRTIMPVEVDFFVGPDFVVTSQAEKMPQLTKLAEECLNGDKTALNHLGRTSPELLFHLTHELMISVFPLLTQLSNDILLAEREIFNEYGHETARKILRIKSNIVQCRQSMQGHKTVLRKFIDRSGKLLDLRGMDLRFDDLIGHTKEIWDYLENDKDTIEAVYDSHTSLITHNASQASQRLAALALIIFPTTLVAAIFSMDVDSMPIRGHQYDFWIMLGFVLTTMAGTFTFLKWKRWL
ncbi:hypothetical protein COY93_03970 [Candidatus Uhrbacteria bacterium CG_4_10_14_0_8_um_filter_58_22]|uniref:Magnesium transporter n=1 Tax=Candidatus Uhrbacteria bacterium CG_4_10_14_0_8_um_filter_58_22 TaxID=1975029 RepID=A0A2M7Q956_9BACT|nr:MAG: hypothetical protein COY93_03970 [Candidatus Uhrbacteria bacterium CG_4_10_14_0_8_um_filter_58_22]